MSFTTQFYSTPQGARELDQSIDSSVRSNTELTPHLLHAKGVIELALGEKYGLSALLSTPFLVGWNPAANSGTKVLEAASITADAITETWTITFTDTTSFSVSGSLSGTQGTGTVSTSYTSTNGVLSIDGTASAWSSGAAVAGDVFYIDTFNTQPSLIPISNLLTGGHLVNTVFNQQQPNEADAGNTFYDRGMELLNLIIEGKAELTSRPARDIAPIPSTWHIDMFGNDVTPYDNTELVSFHRTPGNNVANMFFGGMLSPWW